MPNGIFEHLGTGFRAVRDAERARLALPKQQVEANELKLLQQRIEQAGGLNSSAGIRIRNEWLQENAPELWRAAGPELAKTAERVEMEAKRQAGIGRTSQRTSAQIARDQATLMKTSEAAEEGTPRKTLLEAGLGRLDKEMAEGVGYEFGEKKVPAHESILPFGWGDRPATTERVVRPKGALDNVAPSPQPTPSLKEPKRPEELPKGAKWNSTMKRWENIEKGVRVAYYPE